MTAEKYLKKESLSELDKNLDRWMVYATETKVAHAMEEFAKFEVEKALEIQKIIRYY